MKKANMKSTSRKLFVLLLLLTGACTPLYAANYTRDIDRSKIVAPTDEEMFERFLEVVREGSVDRKYLDDEQIAFSERLKAAATKGEGITLIKPIAQNHDYFAPEFQKALNEARQGRCMEWKIHHSYDWSEWLENKDKFASRSEWEDYERQHGEISVLHYDFKVFHMDIDNNPKNGSEWVLYGSGRHYVNYRHGGKYRMVGETVGKGVYLIFDPVKCRHVDSLSIEDPIHPETLRPSGDITGVIEFESGVFVFHGTRYQSGKTVVRMKGWNQERGTLTRLFTKIYSPN